MNPMNCHSTVPGSESMSSGSPSQFAALDFLFPGFSILSSAVQRYFKIDLNIYIPLVLLFGGLTFFVRYFSEYFWGQLESHFMSTVDIRTDDEIYNMLMAWVAAQSFAKKARRFVVNTNLNSRSWRLWRFGGDDDDDDEGDEELDGSERPAKKKKALSYTPTFGSHYFLYKGRLLIFRRSQNREQGTNLVVSEREEISISCFGRSPWILKELLLEARAAFMQRDEAKTLIYRGAIQAGSSEPTWQRCMGRTSRPFSTVILNEKVKQDLIDDVTDYLNPATRRWYSNRGIPYRRGYLLWGPPGTGKSSLSLALAGFFKLRIYIVSLSGFTSNEENLASLFAELPRRCVVLLEDIDTAGLTHTREENKPADDNNGNANGQVRQGNGAANNDTTGRLSLSGLLNILDGVASQEGRVLIMTTNHLEKLDKALIRPGRVDMQVKFDLADHGMTAAMFRAIFAPLEGEDTPAKKDDKAAAVDPDERQLAEERAKAVKRDEIMAKVEKLAEDFASKLPGHEFSPAELQGYLMKNKRNPEAAVAGVDTWVVETRKEKVEKQEIKDAEEKRQAEEKKKKDEEEENKKAKEKKKRKEAKKKRRQRKERKSEKESGGGGSESESDSTDSSDSESESEGEKEKPSRKESHKGEVNVVVVTPAPAEKPQEVAELAPVDRSNKMVELKEEEVGEDGRPRTRGTDSESGYGSGTEAVSVSVSATATGRRT